MELAIKEAGLEKKQIDYLQYHGTSTELNDRIETRAVKLAFGRSAGRLAGSSLKSLIGHPQGACGAAGVAATLLAMRDGVAPPTINLEDPDDDGGLSIVPEARELRPRSSKPMAVLNNSFGFGGHNVALIFTAA